MSDAITVAREAIERRIREIEEETKRLRRALAELVGGDRRPVVRRRGPGSGRSGSGSRRRRNVAPRGQRREQLLAYLEENPGAKPAEIANAMGTTPANVHNVLRKARQDKMVRRRRGGGYELAGMGSPPGREPGGGQGTNADTREAGLLDPPRLRKATISAEGDGGKR